MENINRKEAPSFNKIDRISLVKPVYRKLSNGADAYIINSGTQDLIKIEFLFRAGNWFENKPLVASAVNCMLTEGTSKHNAAQLADEIDYYGAFFQNENNFDWSSATLFTLTKYLDKTLPLVTEILTDSVFPEKEFETYRQNKKLQLEVNNERVDFVARKKFNELLFGPGHPYGYVTSADNYNALSREDLLSFFQNFYSLGESIVIISGKVNEEQISLIDNLLHKAAIKSPGGFKENFREVQSVLEREHLIYKEDSIQSAIRIGKRLFNKQHPDFMPMQVLNSVLGGYFGSRLMTNIREDKGYTYGIGSAVVSLNNEGYFFITTEVGVDVCKNAVNEIYFEIERLHNELVPEEELQLVKNYILGTFLRSVDGPFAWADKVKSLVTYGMDIDYYYRFIETVKNISSEDILSLARKYLQRESLTELVVGKK